MASSAMVNTRKQAEELVSYVRYPPHGVRSFGPTRALFSAGANDGAEADDNILCFAMIETREAFDNLDAIVAPPVSTVSTSARPSWRSG